MSNTAMVPKLRPVEPRWVQCDGQPALLLRDPLHLTDNVALVPPPMVALLGLFDGVRDVAAIRSAFQLRTGIVLTASKLERLLAQLDDALLLDSPRYHAALEHALEEYRRAPCRPPALAGQSYPGEPEALEELLGE